MWKEQFKIIEKIIATQLAQEGKKYTLGRAAELLDLKPSTFQRIREGQRPSADDLEKICLRLGLNPAWALLGVGEPIAGARPGEFNPDFVGVCDTLHEIAYGMFAGRFDEFALAGGITPQQLFACVGSQMLPPATAFTRWVHRYRLNANFLLAHIGQPTLTEEQYNEPGPATWVKEREEREFGPLEDADEDAEAGGEFGDPVTRRLDQALCAMREAGVDELKILAAARDMLEAEMGKLAKARGDCANPSKAAGDDSV